MKTGRNERCPCGSGKKFKNCHLGRQDELRPDRKHDSEPTQHNTEVLTETNTFCPYHGYEHPAGTLFTKEHIVPFSVGGSNKLIIRVCKEANDKAGSHIDSPLINNFFTMTQRIIKNIKGHGDSEPKWTFQGKLDLGGTQVQAKHTITPNNQTTWIQPSIKRTPHDQKEIIQIACAPEQLPEIVDDINKKLRKKGFSTIQIDKETINSQTMEFNSPQMQIQGSFDLTSFHRGFVKIALGIAHFALGETYSRSRDADLLREFIWEDDPAKREASLLRGYIWPTPADQATELLKFDDWHVLSILNFDSLYFHGILFGKFHGAIKLTDGVSKIAHAPAPRDGIVFLINPESRSMYKINYIKYILKKNKNLKLK